MDLGGLRISEACSLRIEDLVRKRGAIKAVDVIGKGDRQRRAPIHKVLAGYIDQWLTERKKPKSGYLFPGDDEGHISRITGWRWFAEFKEKNGIDGKITPHKLRHTYATRLHKKDTPLLILQAMLGHADLRTTGIYAHVDDEELEKYVEKLL